MSAAPDGTSALDELRALHEQAALHRKRGDSLRKAGRDGDAGRAYESGLNTLVSALAVLDRLGWREAPGLPGRRAETLGSMAGLLQRLDRPEDAHARYGEGAAIERDFSLGTTYNRVNEIKYALLTRASTVAAVEQRARETADRLAATLLDPATQQLGDDGWAWADLGDCRAIGDELEEASRAYRTFITKAGTAAPARTVEVLQRIAEVLAAAGDPDAGRITATIAALQSLVSARTPDGGR